MTYSLDKFFAHVKSREMFSRQEEAELYLRFKNHGDMKAREKLILSQSRLALYHAFNFMHYDKSLLVDYFNVGMCTVISVVDNLFDPNKGKLTSIAFQNIFVALREFSHEQHIIKGMSLSNSSKIKRETGKAVGTKIMYPPIIYLDSKISAEDFCGGATVAETVASKCDTPEESLAKFECSKKLKCVLDDAMQSFSERERVILQGRLFFDDSKISLEVLGSKFGIRRQRVHQIEQKAKKKVVKYLRINYPDCRKDFGLSV